MLEEDGLEPYCMMLQIGKVREILQEVNSVSPVKRSQGKSSIFET